MDIIQKTWKTEHTFLPESALLLNIETTGLRPSSSYVYMISAGYRVKEQFFYTAMLTGGRQEEAALLKALHELASSFSDVYCYGGNAFAFRFLSDRYAGYSDMTLFHPESLQIDLQKRIRPLQRLLPLPNTKKAQVETFLSFHRAADRTGKELIPIYGAWERNRIPEAKEVLLEHAETDIHSLSSIYRLTAYTDFLDGCWDEIRTEQKEDSLLFTVILRHPVPVSLSYHTEQASVFLQEDQAMIRVPLLRGRLRYFLSPCRDYYYLPAEDTAVHKSVGQFVDKSMRVKAVPENCYVVREGVFVPVPAAFPGPVFSHSYQTEPYYTQYDEKKWQQDPSFMKKYIAAIV